MNIRTIKRRRLSMQRWASTQWQSASYISGSDKAELITLPDGSTAWADGYNETWFTCQRGDSREQALRRMNFGPMLLAAGIANGTLIRGEIEMAR
jgi:hypothetical protein